MHRYATSFPWEKVESSDMQTTYTRKLGPTESFVHTLHFYQDAASSPIVSLQVSHDFNEENLKKISILTWSALQRRHPLLAARVELTCPITSLDLDHSPSPFWSFVLNIPPQGTTSSLRFIDLGNQTFSSWIEDNILGPDVSRSWEQSSSACCYILLNEDKSKFTLLIHSLHCISNARGLISLLDEFLQILIHEGEDSTLWDDVEKRLSPAQEDIFSKDAGLCMVKDEDILRLEMQWQSEITNEVMKPTCGLKPTGIFPPTLKTCIPICCRAKLSTEATSRLLLQSKKWDVTITHLMYAALVIAMSEHRACDDTQDTFRFFPNSMDLSRLFKSRWNNSFMNHIFLKMTGYSTILPKIKEFNNNKENLLNLSLIAKQQYEKFIKHPQFWTFTTIMSWSLYKSVETLIIEEATQIGKNQLSNLSPISSPIIESQISKRMSFTPSSSSIGQYLTSSSWASTSSIMSMTQPHADNLQTSRAGPQVPVVNSLGDLSKMIKINYGNGIKVNDVLIYVRPDPAALGTHIWTFKNELTLQIITNGSYWAIEDIQMLLNKAAETLSNCVK